MNGITRIIVLAFLALLCIPVNAQEYKQVNDISYTLKTDAYSQQRLKLDVYHPKGATDCPVVVWFHGGGLEGGNKEIPAQLREKGLVVVGVNYRLLPKVTVREILDDASEAVTWVFRHITEYGGDTRKIVVTGHSAGGYISMMLCLDKKWLAAYGIDADDVMMYAPSKRALVSEMGGNLETVAKDVKLNVNFNEAMVDSYRLIGYENRVMSREDFDDDTKDGGEIGAGHRLTVLYELDLTDSAVTGTAATSNDPSQDFLTLSVRYKEPDEDASKLLTYEVGVEALNDTPSENIRWAEAVAAFGMILRESEFKGTADFEMVKDLASNIKAAENDEIKQEFIKLVEGVMFTEDK